MSAEPSSLELCRAQPRFNKVKGSTPEDGWFILVYRLAIDAKTRKGDGGAGGKYPSLLEDFQTATASMARKRHLASSARGF